MNSCITITILLWIVSVQVEGQLRSSPYHLHRKPDLWPGHTSMRLGVPSEGLYRGFRRGDIGVA